MFLRAKMNGVSVSEVPIKNFLGKRCRMLCSFGTFGYVLALILVLSSAFLGCCGDDDGDSSMVSVPLGFEISGFDRTKNWVSKNGVFAFGFLEKYGGDDVDGFVVGVRYNLGDQEDVNVPVWSVGGGVRVSGNSTFRLAMDGRLELIENHSGIVVWSSNTSTLGVQKASLLDSGNLVLLDDDNKVVWGSFSSPINTLLPGQSLHFPQNLRAPSTQSVSSYYSLEIRRTGELALVWEHNVTYWRSHFGSSASVEEARFESTGVLGLYGDSSEAVWFVTSKDFGDPSVTLRHLRIDQDGNLRMYSWNDEVRSWKVGWQAVINQCNVFGSCGLYGICGYNTSGPTCNCLYTDSLDSGTSGSAVDLGSSGCKKMVDLGNCRLHTSMMVMKQTVLYGLYPPLDVNMILSEEACKEYCTNDTSCVAATSKNDGSGVCTIKRTSFVSGYTDPSVPSVSFLKVCQVPLAVAARAANHRYNGESVSLPSSRLAGGESRTRLIEGVGIIVLMTVSIVLGVEGIVLWVMFKRRKIETRLTRLRKDGHMNPHCTGVVRVTFEEIKDLTDEFAVRLGPSVFKGTLPNRIPVVAKILSGTVVPEKEFRLAVSTLGAMHHRNLASLRGFCYEPEHKLLIYEFVPNGSLDKWLLDLNKDPTKWSWHQRLNIALEVARALAYLHLECPQCIPHGNLKLENVLLGESFSVKLTDFGLQTLMSNESASSSESPSEKDIHMLGEMLLQIVTCQREVLMESPQEILDELSRKETPPVGSEEDMKALERVVRIAFWCMQTQPFLRPSISEVLKVLEGTLSVDNPPSDFVFRHESMTDSEAVA
ncbi:PREDICTED: G-type lectin S-receptor-like serine/threonine-protein kinase SD3-1 isoform X2 [Ipomoea nil]|nr:PREDICTED: G-type lectin S-receptor-like serine/threonine-protein kinase SD3-1 isoform X2 [Ipomoea nil]